LRTVASKRDRDSSSLSSGGSDSKQPKKQMTISASMGQAAAHCVDLPRAQALFFTANSIAFNVADSSSFKAVMDG
jgi:hypothetical protein